MRGAVRCGIMKRQREWRVRYKGVCRNEESVNSCRSRVTSGWLEVVVVVVVKAVKV